MTPFVQPLDAGIIRCFKAYYWQQFCLHAIEKDDLGEHDIYKITLLEAMLMAKAVWGHVDSSTIQHCWNHMKIQGYVISDWQ
jgi:DDE superfamily endonuclease